MEDYVPYCIYEDTECTNCDICEISPIELWKNKLKESLDEEDGRDDKELATS